MALSAKFGWEGKENALALKKCVFLNNFELGTIKVVKRHVLLVIARARFIHVCSHSAGLVVLPFVFLSAHGVRGTGNVNSLRRARFQWLHWARRSVCSPVTGPGVSVRCFLRRHSGCAVKACENNQRSPVCAE